MPPIRNAAVAKGQITTTGFNTLYTVPSSNHFILKAINLANAGAASSTIYLYLADSVSGISLVVKTDTLATAQFDMWSGWTVLNAGDSVLINNSAGPINFWIAGAVLPYAPGF